MLKIPLRSLTLSQDRSRGIDRRYCSEEAGGLHRAEYCKQRKGLISNVSCDQHTRRIPLLEGMLHRSSVAEELATRTAVGYHPGLSRSDFNDDHCPCIPYIPHLYRRLLLALLDHRDRTVAVLCTFFLDAHRAGLATVGQWRYQPWRDVRMSSHQAYRQAGLQHVLELGL